MKNLCYLPAIAVAAMLVSCKDSKSGATAASDTVVLAKTDSTPKPGTKLTVSKKMAMTNGSVKVNAGGVAMEGSCNMSETQTETTEFTTADKAKSTVTAGEKIQAMKLNGQDMPNEPAPNALLNKVVNFTKAAGKWSGALDSGTATTEQQTEITKKEKKLNKPTDAAMYGTTPRKVGDSWTVDAADLMFAEGEKDTTGNLKITFKGIETYEGRKCARLEGPMEIHGKTDADKGGQDLSMKGDVVVLRSIDDLVDLKVEFKGKMEMKGNVPGGSMSMDGGITMEESTKVN